ncbi:hypothetical protein [Glaciimonas soli]|uniref:Secreted protein n=1 Tax=Glaciimonas soli TaxID=2590999 RepID=A0A843YVC9_9BURK|nr:hypothetical protein [Glaciimonas soli]MQR01654.1 hypothetical protein [Glaciimonas soli]
MNKKLSVMTKYFLILSTLYFGSISFAQAEPVTLCSPNEVVFFSCPLEKSKKIVSLCESSKTANLPYLEYRFGTPQKIELRYRGLENDIPKKFNRVEVNYGSNSDEVIWFKNDSINYLLHFPMREGPLLEIIKDGNSIANFSCKEGWTNTKGDPDATLTAIEKQEDGIYVDLQKKWWK